MCCAILYSIALKHLNFLAEIALSHTIVKHTYLFLQRAIGRYQVHNLAKKVGAARSVKILKKVPSKPLGIICISPQVRHKFWVFEHVPAHRIQNYTLCKYFQIAFQVPFY